MVQAGQLLAELDNSIASAQLVSLQPQFELAADLFNRQKRLWEQKVGSEVQYLQAKASKESIEKNLNVLREQIEMAQIKSPISGVVDYVSLKVGQYAAPSFDPAFRVVNMNQLKVKSMLAESYIAQVKKGDPVSLYFPDAQLELTANLSHVAKVIDPMTRTFVVESKLTGNIANLRPNMVSVMKIVDYKNDNAFVIPINLIQNAQNTQYVYIVVKENGKNIARRKTLQVGKTYNSQAEILGGLAPGDKLITTGYLDVTDGTEVSVK
jgi:RND family efflux transporter MFP subunit